MGKLPIAIEVPWLVSLVMALEEVLQGEKNDNQETKMQFSTKAEHGSLVMLQQIFR